MTEEKVIDKPTYVHILTKEGKPIFHRSFLPEGTRIIIEEIEPTADTPWEGTLFNMGAMVRDRVYIGHVVRESKDVVVIFSDTDGIRWDIPKKNIKVVGKNVFFDMDMKDLARYRVTGESPLPPPMSD